MDIDTSEAIKTLGAEVKTLGAEVTTLGAEVKTLRGDLRQVEVTLSAKIDVLYESLRDDIRMIAEGLVTLDRKVESFRRPPDIQ